jgi:Male sterility protein
VTDWHYRNGYEESKAAGERSIRERFPEMPIATFSCSLVVRRSLDGAISRFHGIYPLIKLMALMTPPFLVGRPDCLIDIVPSDWVARELATQTLQFLGGGATRGVVAAAGPERLRMDRMVAVIEDRINRFRDAAGFPPAPGMTFLPYRRWSFLRRSLEKWQPKELPVNNFRYFERLLDVYKPYTESDIVLPPCNVAGSPPDPGSALSASVDFCLARNAHVVSSRLKRESSKAGMISVTTANS